MKYIVVVIWILIGLLLKFKKPKEKTEKEMNKVLKFNYFGNLITCQTLALILYLTYGYDLLAPYACSAAMFYAALILHIHDITGKPINSIIDKLKFTDENLKNNVFVRITLFFSIILFLIGVILPNIL